MAAGFTSAFGSTGVIVATPASFAAVTSALEAAASTAVFASSAFARASSFAASFSSFVESVFASIAASCAFNAASIAAFAAGFAFAAGSTFSTFSSPRSLLRSTDSSVVAASTLFLASWAKRSASFTAASFSSVVKSSRPAI